MINITLLGTSALRPLPRRALTSAFLTFMGHSVLFDCGEGTQTAAASAGISLMKTEIIAITHFHGDHIFGLPGLLQTMMLAERTDTLYIAGPECPGGELKHILALAGTLTFPVERIVIPPEGLSLSTWPQEARISSFPTQHRIASQGYCFTLGRAGKFMPQKAEALGIPVKLWRLLQKGENVESDGRLITPGQVMGEPRKGLKFTFTGDTAECHALDEAAKGSDLLICEATYGANEHAAMAKERGHMVFSQAAMTAKKAGVKQLWLAHYSPMVDEPLQYLANATEIFPDTACGYDGMRMELQFQE